MAPDEAKEISYHAIAYVGMAKAHECIVAANEVFAERGIELPLAGQATTDAETRFDEGLAVQKGIFGSAIDAAYENAPADQLHIQRFLSANCFGDYYTRGGLDVAERELVTFALILACLLYTSTRRTGGLSARSPGRCFFSRWRCRRSREEPSR